MVKAIWNGAEIAKSDNTVIVENNQYFPMEDVNKSLLKETDYHTTCPWKGFASYYTIEVDGKSNENAAWFYKEPKVGAEAVKDRVAFWKGVEIVVE